MMVVRPERFEPRRTLLWIDHNGGEGLEGQPRPMVVDPSARWDFSEQSKIFKLAKEGRGRAPYIITTLQSPPAAKKELLDQ
jgi:2,5-diamino-6-(ribosylamino)-4(3H)-pyrimidinone 5'-phosphate reductase